jgi:prevent-host-death family protein
METIPASQFKEKCLYLLDHIGPEGLIISKHGRPVARLIPYQRAGAENIGRMKGRMSINGDIGGTGLRWDAES